jgi:hypothetical protein
MCPCHDIAEILLELALNINQSIIQSSNTWHSITEKLLRVGIKHSFSGGRSRSTWREPPTMGKQLVNFITCGCESIYIYVNLVLYWFVTINNSFGCTKYESIIIFPQSSYFRIILFV